MVVEGVRERDGPLQRRDSGCAGNSRKCGQAGGQERRENSGGKIRTCKDSAKRGNALRISMAEDEKNCAARENMAYYKWWAAQDSNL